MVVVGVVGRGVVGVVVVGVVVVVTIEGGVGDEVEDEDEDDIEDDEDEKDGEDDDDDDEDEDTEEEESVIGIELGEGEEEKPDVRDVGVVIVVVTAVDVPAVDVGVTAVDVPAVVTTVGVVVGEGGSTGGVVARVGVGAAGVVPGDDIVPRQEDKKPRGLQYYSPDRKWRHCACR